MKTAILYFSVILLMLSCTKETIVTHTSPSDGILTGRVIIANIPDPLAKMGVRVSLPDINMSTLTDSNGLYTIKNIPMGTYSILFQKEGCADFRIFNYISYGKGEIKYPVTVLYKNPVFTFDSLVTSPKKVIRVPGDTGYFVGIDFSFNNPDKSEMSGALVFGIKPDVALNNSNCLLSTAYSPIPNNPNVYSNYDITEFVRSLRYMGLHPGGTTIYIKLYPCNYLSSYKDPKTGKYICPAIGPPASASFKIPD